MSQQAIVIGAGIVGLATATALAKKGISVTVIDRHGFAVGASVRNFGMLWPIGQPSGVKYERASRSLAIWKELCAKAGIWMDPAGSLHLAYDGLEEEVLQGFLESVSGERPYQLLTAEEVLQRSPVVRPDGLKAGLYSPEECIVDSPLAIRALPAYLSEAYGIRFMWETAVQEVTTGRVRTMHGNFEADLIFVCTGPDFEMLFPEEFAARSVTRCKLQMLRLGDQPPGWRLGPSLCGGLSLTHYPSFGAAGDALQQLKARFVAELPEHVRWGIHVMVSQHSDGGLIVGDSHEYGNTLEPFDREEINVAILSYLKRFSALPSYRVTRNWNGIYTKMTDGSTELVCHPLPGVTVINGLGGNGMTLSFGLAEEVISLI